MDQDENSNMLVEEPVVQMKQIVDNAYKEPVQKIVEMEIDKEIEDQKIQKLKSDLGADSGNSDISYRTHRSVEYKPIKITVKDKEGNILKVKQSGPPKINPVKHHQKTGSDVLNDWDKRMKKRKKQKEKEKPNVNIMNYIPPKIDPLKTPPRKIKDDDTYTEVLHSSAKKKEKSPINLDERVEKYQEIPDNQSNISKRSRRTQLDLLKQDSGYQKQIDQAIEENKGIQTRSKKKKK